MLCVICEKTQVFDYPLCDQCKEASLQKTAKEMGYKHWTDIPKDTWGWLCEMDRKELQKYKKDLF